MLSPGTRRALQGALGALALCATTPGEARASMVAPPDGRAAVATPASAADGQAEAPSDAKTQEDYKTDLARAVEAWTAGDWTAARDLLEPLVSELEKIEDPFERERVLRFMADATLLDSSLDPARSQQLARGYVGRLLDTDPQWSPPPGAHSDPLYTVTTEVKEARRRERAAACEAELVACAAETENEKTLRERLQTKHEALQEAYDDEIVIVTDRIALNRAVALVPFGVGHFYNQNKPLGAAFLSSELVFGGVGLGLMLYRIFGLNCARTSGFQPGSLVCVGKDNRDLGVAVRNAEQTFGILFASSMVVDVVLAQILFKSSRVVGQRKVRRGDLESLGIDASDVDTVAPQDADEDSAKLEIRPTSTVTRGGAGLGLRLRF